MATKNLIARRRLARPLASALVLTALLAAGCGGSEEGVTRAYYIAADEMVWDYAPTGKDGISGKDFGEEASVFVERGPDRIGSRYVKAMYQEYTDKSFEQLKPRPPEWKHLGMLGPAIHAEVGDTVEVVFKNNTKRPVSVHPHGVFYEKDSEGAPYADGTDVADKKDDAVPPGETHTYSWGVPERAGPGPQDASSVMWMYHSHTDEPKDTNSGLMGPIIVTAEGEANDDGSPEDVDREFVTMFSVVDENDSWYLNQNIRRFTGQPGAVDVEDEGFVESNLMHSVNGFVFGNLPGLEMREGENVRWYVFGMGTEVDLHTPHWHGQTVLINGRRLDVSSVLPADVEVADMVPDDPGTWLYHCHVNDHIKAGMSALFTVTKQSGA